MAQSQHHTPKTKRRERRRERGWRRGVPSASASGGMSSAVEAMAGCGTFTWRSRKRMWGENEAEKKNMCAVGSFVGQVGDSGVGVARPGLWGRCAGMARRLHGKMGPFACIGISICGCTVFARFCRAQPCDHDPPEQKRTKSANQQLTCNGHKNRKKVSFCCCFSSSVCCTVASGKGAGRNGGRRSLHPAVVWPPWRAPGALPGLLACICAFVVVVVLLLKHEMERRNERERAKKIDR